MYEIRLKNLITQQEFIKTIDSPYLFNKFLIKIKYSNKVRMLSYAKIY